MTYTYISRSQAWKDFLIHLFSIIFYVGGGFKFAQYNMSSNPSEEQVLYISCIFIFMAWIAYILIRYGGGGIIISSITSFFIVFFIFVGLNTLDLKDAEVEMIIKGSFVFVIVWYIALTILKLRILIDTYR